MPLQLTDVLCDAGIASTVFDCLLLEDGAQVRQASKACAAAVAAHPWAGLRAPVSRYVGGPGAAPWGDFAKFHRMDEPLATAYRYNAVVAAADGSLWAV